LNLFAVQHRLPRPQLSPAALETLTAHRWPGNVRELRNVAERLVLKASGGDRIRPSDLPADIFHGNARPTAAAGDAPASSNSAVQQQLDELTVRMLRHGESFWSTVYPLFMARDLTRADLRRVVQTGLESTNGNYRLLVQLFNMPTEDYKRFLGFLRKHDCHLPFQRFRTVPSRLRAPEPQPIRNRTAIGA
jgi:DNA-binding NtrC family response regulator